MQTLTPTHPELLEGIDAVELTRLTPEQVIGEWVDYVSPAVEACLPPDVDDPAPFQRFAALVFEGQLLVHVVAGRRLDQTSVALGIVILGCTKDPLTLERQLVVYSLHAWETVPMPFWQEAWNQLEIMACDLQCDTIVSYTRVERVKEILETVGCRPETTLYKKDVINVR